MTRESHPITMNESLNQLHPKPFLFLISIFLMAASPLFSASSEAAASDSGTYFVYFGTYTGPKSKGIYRAEFDTGTGRLTSPELAAETRNPTFLTLDHGSKVLYAVNEVGDFGDGKSGGVSSFKVDRATGQVTFINEEPSGGAGPCHLAVDAKGKCVLVANYGSGGIAALPVDSEGRLRQPSSSIQHHGSSVNPQRQESPHAHFITWDPANRLVLTCDLGLDKVMAYQLTRPVCSLSPNEPPAFNVKPGSGPRHLVFHPNGRFAYIINEMASTVTLCSYDSPHGEFKEVQTISTLPEGFTGQNTAAEVAVHPSGRWVYASNRGHDSIAVYECDPATGMLRVLQHQSTEGKTPRHFALDPTSTWLIAENQDSNNVVVFKVDPQTGQLAPNGQSVNLTAPVCAVFVKKP